MLKEKYGKVVCHDPSLGFVTKARAWKDARWECSLGVTFTLSRVWEGVKECWSLDGLPNFLRMT
jgi:hypothetical protein